jgi:hypothetical protein
VKFRKWGGISDEGEAEIWSNLVHNVAEKAAAIGAAQLLSSLESTASHFIRIGARTRIDVVEFEGALTNLCRQHILPVPKGKRSMAGHS